MITLAIDPGKHHCGWAIFVEKKLLRSGVVRVDPDRDTHGPYYRQGRHRQVVCQSSAKIAQEITMLANMAQMLHGGQAVIEIVLEMMHVYVDQDTKKLKDGSNPVELLYIQTTSGAIIGALSQRHPCRVRFIDASEWKKQLKDLATWTMVRNALMPDEVEIAKRCGTYDETGPLGKQFHHGLEAKGIGLWSLYRL